MKIITAESFHKFRKSIKDYLPCDKAVWDAIEWPEEIEVEFYIKPVVQAEEVGRNNYDVDLTSYTSDISKEIYEFVAEREKSHCEPHKENTMLGEIERRKQMFNEPNV
jgi:hypothetical protein